MKLVSNYKLNKLKLSHNQSEQVIAQKIYHVEIKQEQHNVVYYRERERERERERTLCWEDQRISCPCAMLGSILLVLQGILYTSPVTA